jgi:hypothetical protein
MSYFYLSERAPFSYTVQAKPPPADASTATVHRGAADGDAIYTENLAKEGQSTFNLDMSRLKLGDSPVFIEFTFKKGEGVKTTARAVVLAEPAPSKVSAPRSAALGDQVTLKVSQWAALAYDQPGQPRAIVEIDQKRIADAKSKVAWRVGDQDLPDKGESVQLTIGEAHVGKALAIEAYIGAPSGRAVATLDVFKIDSLTPDASVADPTKQYVNLKASDGDGCGRTIDLVATVVPPVKGTTVYFTLDKNLSRTRSSPPDLQARIAAKVTKQATTDDGGVAKATLTLATYGGDQYRAIASLKKDSAPGDAGTVATRWYEVWRRLNYETDFMKRPDGTTYADRSPTDAVEAQLRKFFIDLVKTGQDDSPPLRRVVTFAQGEAYTKAIRQGTGEPHYFHLVYVYACARDRETITNEYSAESNEDWEEILGMKDFCLDPDDWIAGCTYKLGARTGTVPKENIKLIPDDGPDGVTYTIQFDVKSLGLEPAEGNPVKLKLKIKNYVELGGFQTGPCTVIGCHWSENRRKLATAHPDHLLDGDLVNTILSTSLHEPGHSFGLASKTFPETPVAQIPTTYYMNGWHCHENSNGCLMYETIAHTTPVPAPRFCDSCTDAVRARDLSALPIWGNQGF